MSSIYLKNLKKLYKWIFHAKHRHRVSLRDKVHVHLVVILSGSLWNPHKWKLLLMISKLLLLRDIWIWRKLR